MRRSVPRVDPAQDDHRHIVIGLAVVGHGQLAEPRRGLARAGAGARSQQLPDPCGVILLGVASLGEPIGEENERVPGQHLEALIDQLGVRVDPQQHPASPRHLLDLPAGPDHKWRRMPAVAQGHALVVVPDVELHHHRSHEAVVGSLLERIASPAFVRPVPRPADGLQVEGAVRVASGPWEVEEGWWTESAVRREYWDVELDSGGLYRIYREMDNGRWFLDGLYD